MQIFRTRTVVYTALAVFVGLVALAAMRASKANLHDYSARRSERVAVIRLDDGTLRELLRHAFAFRLTGSAEEPQVTFQTGMCLLAHRASENLDVTPADKVVQLAVLELWNEEWMRDYSLSKIEELRRQYVAGLDAPPPAETLERMRDEFVQGLEAQEEFASNFKRLLELSAARSNQTLQWGDEEFR